LSMTPAQVEKLYRELGSHRAVAEKIGKSRSWVQQVLVKLKNAKMRISEQMPRRSVANGDIEDFYLEYLVKYRQRPALSDLVRAGFTKDSIKSKYGNVTGLHELMEVQYADEISEYVATARSLFTRSKMEKAEKLIGQKSRFFITTAVAGKRVHSEFLASIDAWCKANGGVLLVLPCADVWSRKNGSDIDGMVFDPALKDRHVVGSKLSLNNSLSILDIKVSAKQIKPLTGLERIGQRNNSFIMASPKQFLHYTATSNDKKMPHAGITTGALTVADYDSDRYMSERLSFIAESDHTLGGVIVEIEDDRIFHFRHVQAASDGSFVDLCTRWSASDTTKERAWLILGDWHSGATDEHVKTGVKDVIKTLPIREIVLHDFFDGYSINHHDFHDPGKMAKKHDRHLHKLKAEIYNGGIDLNWFVDDLKISRVVIVKSNHDEFLDKYLDSGRYFKDYQNSTLAHELMLAKNRGEDVVRYAFETYGFLKRPQNVVWLGRDESYKVGGVELGAHGDLGSNGSRGSLQSLENAYGNCVVGHSHTAAIYRGVFRVGTSSRLSLDYNKGPTSWTHTFCLLYEDGSRQLVNFIGSSWRLKKKR